MLQVTPLYGSQQIYSVLSQQNTARIISVISFHTESANVQPDWIKIGSESLINSPIIFIASSFLGHVIVLETTKGKRIAAKNNYKKGWVCKKYRNKVGMKTQEDYPATKNHGQQRWQDYCTSLVYSGKRSTLPVFLEQNFSVAEWSSGLLFLPGFCTFYRPIHTCS